MCCHTAAGGRCTSKATRARRSSRSADRVLCGGAMLGEDCRAPALSESLMLQCTAYDFYAYNMHGPYTSRFGGERSHFHLTVDRPGTYSITIVIVSDATQVGSCVEATPQSTATTSHDQDDIISSLPTIIVSPKGRVSPDDVELETFRHHANLNLLCLFDYVN